MKKLISVLMLLSLICAAIGAQAACPAIDAGDYPVVDGSTATLPLSYRLMETATGVTEDEAKQAIHHNKTTESFYALVNGVVYLGIALCAPLLIWIVYGEKYMNVIPLLQILNVNYLVYCLRNLMGNVIAAIKKVKMNLLFAVVSGALNIVLNLTLIPWLGAAGAAVATLVVTISVAALDCTYVLRYFRKEK